MTEKNEKKVLIVEDVKMLLNALKDKFTKSGYTVLTARNGEEAEDVLKKNIPDLVLLDVLMAKKDGITLLEEMRSSKDWQSIPVIMLSNLSQQQDIERAQKAGCNKYLIKADVTINEIVQEVESCLEECSVAG